MKSIFQNYVEMGYSPDDPKDVRLKKSSLLVVSGPFAIAGLLWGIIYFANGLTLSGAIPFSYGILSIINIFNFKLTKKYTFFRNSQLFLILILPFALQISLGGFVQSSAVMYWAIIAPAGAMFFDSVRRSAYWFGAYLLLVVVAYVVNDFIPGYVDNNLSDGFIIKLFLMNIMGVSCIIFGILYYFVSTITDLNNDIEKKNDALKEQSERLREMDEIKSQFFANISHEFRTPLTLILGLARKQMANPNEPPNLKDSQTMRRNATRLLQLINQLLDLSKLESGELKLQATKGDIISFAKTTTAQFESMAADKDIQLTFNGYPVDQQAQHEPLEAYFDSIKLQKVISNLLSNAIKFTPSGREVSVEVDATSGALGGKEMVTIKIINTGVEIPADKLSHVFDRFFQVDGSSNREFEGTGIGLSLVKELVELHHGKVAASSKMLKTCFTIELPLGDGHLSAAEKGTNNLAEIEDLTLDSHYTPVNAPHEESEAVLSDDESGQLEVLIVEDNPDLRSFIRSVLENDYNISEAVDGLDGLEKAASIPDLIVSDVMMPKMDGYNLCKRLKTDDKTNHIPVILLTAKAGKENKLAGLDMGADDYLVKPFDEDELKARIKNLIAIRRKLQQKFQGELQLRPKEVQVSSVHQQFLENLKEVIEKNIDNELFGVDDLGKEIGMSRSQIYRKLKALTDQSATTFIRNYRLYRAAELLKQDAGNITEIAFDVGFNSQTYFSSSFQELFGCSPSEYKKQH